MRFYDAGTFILAKAATRVFRRKLLAFRFKPDFNKYFPKGASNCSHDGCRIPLTGFWDKVDNIIPHQSLR